MFEFDFSKNLVFIIAKTQSYGVKWVMAGARARERNRVKDSWLGAVIKKVFYSRSSNARKKAKHYQLMNQQIDQWIQRGLVLHACDGKS